MARFGLAIGQFSYCGRLRAATGDGHLADLVQFAEAAFLGVCHGEGVGFGRAGEVRDTAAGAPCFHAPELAGMVGTAAAKVVKVKSHGQFSCSFGEVRIAEARRLATPG